MSLLDNIKTHAKTIKLSSEKARLLDSFLKNGFPTTKDEEWKYTSLKKIISSAFSIEAEGAKISSSDIEKYSLGFAQRIVFLNGSLISNPAIKGVTVSDFSEFQTTNNNPISELNSALAKNGVTIKIKENIVIPNPIELLFLSNSNENSFGQYRNQIIIGKNSEVKFVERIQNLNNTSSFINCFTQIKLAESSKVEYNKTQNDTENSILIDTMDIYQSQNSTCSINTLVFGGKFIRNNLNFEQNGENCNSIMNGISILDNKQFADNHTFIDHKKAYCGSNEMYKGIYLDDSKGVFNGKIMVRPNAQKIDAFQANNNLLLSSNSSIDSKPQLEIYADDVKCSHGCTIGQLDDDAVFYMRSRGISQKEAKAILTFAFASEVINNISLPEIKKLAEVLIADKLKVNLDFNM